MSEQCLINFADCGSHLENQKRLRRSFLANGYEGDFLFFNSHSEIDCPSHQQVHYAFKPYAFEFARGISKINGYRYLLWCDASVYAIRPVRKVFDIIKELGYYLQLNGWKTGEWCSDAALGPLEITREESFEYPHLMANVMGFDLENPTAREFLDRYYGLAVDGTAFKGAWSNNNHEVSTDDRVLGHRHDQTCASVIAWKLGMKEWQQHKLVYNEDGMAKIPETAIFELRH